MFFPIFNHLIICILVEKLLMMIIQILISYATLLTPYMDTS
jgi:hypothetical protein